MRSLLKTTGLSLGLIAFAASANAQDCGQVTIASMNWQSAELLSNVDQIILSAGYGCTAEITVGDTVPTITSMAERGQPDVAPEAWIDLLPDVVSRGVEDGRLIQAANVLPDGGVNGWWIPRYLAEAHPEIRTIEDALARPDLFPSPEDPSRGAIYNGPQGWGATVITAQLYIAYGAEAQGFDLIDSGSAAGLDAAMARAYERGEGWLGFYWAPTAMLGKYDMVMLDWGVGENPEMWSCITAADCPDPEPAAWPTDRVYTLVSTRFSERASPEVMAYLNARAWSNSTVGSIMSWMTDNQATGEDGARHFLRERADIWTEWVTPEAAARIQAAL